MNSNSKVYKLVFSAMFLALAMILPFLTGQLQQFGNMLCPMHIPVILCGFFCGPVCGLIIGLVAPLLRFFLFGMPPLLPIGAAMCFELATYGFVSGLLYKLLPKKKINVYVSLIAAMIVGRLVWGIARIALLNLGRYEFGMQAFISGAFITAIPGIILQIVLIPVLVIALNRNVEK